VKVETKFVNSLHAYKEVTVRILRFSVSGSVF